MTIDERLEFLLHSTESLHATAPEMTAQIQESKRRWDLHERWWERMRRVLQAALEAALGDEDKGEEEGEAK